MNMLKITLIMIVPAILLTGLFFLANMDFRIFMGTIILEATIAVILSLQKEKQMNKRYGNGEIEN